MIVLPNSYERYLAALRIYVSYSIAKHGLQPRHLENLKKIYTAEAFYYKNSYKSVDLNRFCTNLLCAVSCVKQNFQFTINANKNWLLNKPIFASLLLTVAKLSNNCEIRTEENCIIIKSQNTGHFPARVVEIFGGYYLKEIKENRLLLIIPSVQTNIASVYIESEWDLIFDKFSVFNIFFGNVMKD